MMWQYSLSGLPQMLLLLLFNLTVYALVRAVEEKVNGGPVSFWLAAAGVGFGLLALSHALTLWMFAAAFLFALAGVPLGEGEAVADGTVEGVGVAGRAPVRDA